MTRDASQKPVRVVVTGCSGGGKSSLVAEMSKRGFPVQIEPGREVVREELRAGGTALPWSDPKAFAERCIKKGIAAHNAGSDGVTIYDRSVHDNRAALAQQGLKIDAELEAMAASCRYASPVFYVAPWQKHFHKDRERRHGFKEAQAEAGYVHHFYQEMGYDIVELPQIDLSARTDFLMAKIAICKELAS